MTDSRPQSEGFSFYRVPRQLVKGREYRPLSPAGKLLFALLLDRVSLSAKNGWRAALGAGADRFDRAQKAGPGQAGSDLCPAILCLNRTSRLPKRKLLDFRFPEVWRLKSFTSRSQKLMP